jgi:hypothetical protein
MKEASTAVEALSKAEVEAFERAKAAQAAKDAEAKKVADDALATASAATKAAIKAADDAQKAKEKLDAKLESARQTAAERKEKLAEARKAAEKKDKAGKKPKPVSDKDVQKAAVAVGASTNYVPLKANEMREVVHGLALPSSFPKVRQIGEALESCFAGITTDKHLLTALAKITGEKK